MRPAAIIDFEASCLPEDSASYPIEVAIAKADGGSRSWLIKPLPAWRYWDWDAGAEALHGIRRAMLEEQGIKAARVLQELGEEARGCDVYSDCDLDAYWLEVLCEGCHAPLPFPIHYLGERFCGLGATRADVVSALDYAKGQHAREHVARDDARRLALAVRYIEHPEQMGR
jgi:hypothetical protein